MIYEEEYSDDVYIDNDEDGDEDDYDDGNEFVDDFIDQENRDYNRQDMGEFDKMDNGYIVADQSHTSQDQSPGNARYEEPNIQYQQ